MDLDSGTTRLRSRDLVGRILGGFRIEAPLGKGASGVVFRAIQESTGRPVALKILTSNWAADPTNLARFRREALSAAKITHPNVISVVDYGENNGLFFMAMTFVDGHSLADHLKARASLEPIHVARLGFEMGSALDAIATVGLIHRDIKPANIMIANHDGSAYLTDLGLAKAADSSQDITLKGYTVGTPNYIAPEQALAEEELTIACDVYSLGATLYHAATGQLVFARSNAFQVMKAHVKEAPKDPREHRADLPARMATLILRMLEKSPVKRPAPAEIASEFAEAIYEMTGRRPAPPPSGRRAQSGTGSKEISAQAASETGDRRKTPSPSSPRKSTPTPAPQSARRNSGSSTGASEDSEQASRPGSSHKARKDTSSKPEQRPQSTANADPALTLQKLVPILAIIAAILAVVLVILLTRS